MRSFDRRTPAARRPASCEPLEGRTLLAIVRPDHVVIVVEQDRAADMIGNQIMPYLNQLASGGLVYTNSHGVSHPSQPNLLALFSGSTQGVTSNAQGYSFPTQANIAKSLFDAGFSFAGYSENLPADGSQASWSGDGTYPDLYVRYLNPMAMFGNYSGQPNSVVNRTFGAFTSIPTSNYSSLPTVSFIIPNNLHSTHGSNEAYPWAGSDDDADNNLVLRQMADTWLHDNLDAYATWARTHNSLLIVTGDEERYTGGTAASLSTIVHGDPRLVTPGTNNAYVNHYNLLRTVTDMYGVAALGNSASASPFATDAGGKLTPVAGPALVGTTISLASSGNPSVAGHAVTFTATVTPTSGSAAPVGTVWFMDGSVQLGSATLNASGVATFTTPDLGTGSHKITSAYQGGSYFTASSTTRTQTVNATPTSTTTAVTSSVNPSVSGQSVSFAATVTGAGGTPTGTVQFIIDGANVGSPVALVNGSATSASVSSLSVGSHAVAAAYSGDATFAASTSSNLSQTVNKANSSAALTSSANPSVTGQSVTFTATLTAVAPGAGTPTGTVTFKDGSTTLGTGTLNASGVATFSTSTLAAGSHSITASFAGDAKFNGSTSNTVTQVVNVATPGATTTTIASSANPSVNGQPVSFTATVAPTSGGGVPTGTVQFVIDGANFGSPVTLVNGSATSGATSSLSIGSHTVKAIYGGSANFASSTSANHSQTVNKAATVATVASSANPSFYLQQITLSVHLAAMAPGAGVPTGTVTFKDRNTTLGTRTLNASGDANLSVSDLSVATHAITVVYSGDAKFNATTSATLWQVVNSATTAPANDNFANRIAISGATVTTSGTNAAATKQTGEPNHGGNSGGKSVWWSWTAPSTGKVQIDTLGSNFDTLLGVYTGSSVSALTVVPGGSNDDDWDNGTYTSKVQISVTAGTTYQIAVDGYNGAPGSIVLNVKPVTAGSRSIGNVSIISVAPWKRNDLADAQQIITLDALK